MGVFLNQIEWSAASALTACCSELPLQKSAREEGGSYSFLRKFKVETCCAWCGRIKNGDGTWTSPRAARAGHTTTHGICPDCMSLEMCAGEEG